MTATLSTAAGWTAGVALNWAAFAKTDADFHPMTIQNLTLFIGDANQIASVNGSGTFNNNALDIKTPYRIRRWLLTRLIY